MQLEEQVQRYEEALENNPEARNWLLKRGLSEATIRDQRLGYADSGRYSNCISIPYLNPYGGGVRMLRYRFLNPEATHKYESTKGSSIHLYNVENVTANKVWICEGEFDSLILSQLGLPAVAVPGSNGFKQDWKYLFVNADTVSLVFDGDQAGKNGSHKIASTLGSVVEDLRVIDLPEGLDITDYYLLNKDSLIELVS